MAVFSFNFLWTCAEFFPSQLLLFLWYVFESGFFWTMFWVYWPLLDITSIIRNVLKLIQRRHKMKYHQIMPKKDPILLIEDIWGSRIFSICQPWCQPNLGIINCPQLLNFKATCFHHRYIMSSNIAIEILFTLKSVLLASW